MPSLLTPQASKGAEGGWRGWPCTQGYLLAQNHALLHGQTAPVGAQKLWEAGEPMRGLLRDLTFLSDSLMNSGMGSWPFEELKKSSSGLCCACLHDAKGTGRPSLGWVPPQGQGRGISKSYLFKELFIHRRSWEDVCWIMQESGSSWNPGCRKFK